MVLVQRELFVGLSLRALFALGPSEISEIFWVNVGPSKRCTILYYFCVFFIIFMLQFPTIILKLFFFNLCQNGEKQLSPELATPKNWQVLDSVIWGGGQFSTLLFFFFILANREISGWKRIAGHLVLRGYVVWNTTTCVLTRIYASTVATFPRHK